MKPVIEIVPVDKIKPFLGRERDKNKFARIVQNIKKIGLKNPITVRKIKPKKKKKKIYEYEVIKGHGRLLAVQELEWDEIPAFLVEEENECEIVKTFLMENEVRHSLTAAERAKLMEHDFKKGVTISDLARKYGFKETTVYNYLAILETLSPKINKLVTDNKISLKTAKTVGTLSKAEQESLAGTISKEKKSDIEYLVKSMKEQKEKNRIKITRNVLKQRIQNVRVELDEKQKLQQSINEEWVDVVGGIKGLLEDINFIKKLNKHNIDYSKFVRLS